MNQSATTPSQTWLPPKTQHVLASVGAIGAAVVLPTILPTAMANGTLLAGAAGAVGGLGQNLLSDFIQRFFDRRENDPTLPALNGDLLRLVGDAIAREVAAVARAHTNLEKNERERILTFAGKVAPVFVELITQQELPDIAPPDVQQLLRDAARNVTPPVGTIENWQQMVTRLASHCDAALTVDTEQELAHRLHTHLWESIRIELKRDFTEDGRAYAALHLSFMGDVLATLNTLIELPEMQTQLTRELLDELRAQKTQVAAPKVHAIVEKLSPADRTRVSALTQRFDQLSSSVDKQYRRLSDQIAQIDRSAQRRHIVTQQRLWWLLLIGTAIASGVLLLLHGQNAHRQDTAQVGEKIEALAEQLLARSSVKDPESDRLKIENDQLKNQLQAALQRLASAEAAGSEDARQTLAKLRKDGNAKALGMFLDEQLSVKQSDIVELLHERLAVAYVSGEIDRAEQCAQQILAMLPDDLAATNWLGHIYSLRGDLAAAETQYRRFRDLAPDDEAVKATALAFMTWGVATTDEKEAAEE